MKKLFTTFKTLILGGLLFSSTLVDAQTIAGATGSYPLNTDRQYANGISPNASDKYKNAITAYNSWKQTYTATDCGGPARVIFDFYQGGLGATDRSETVSEGIAYGMLLSAYAGDRSLFDGLWSFYKNHRNGNGVMNWKIKNCNQVVGANGASDAELDVAMALIVASYQWQNDNYLNDAKNMIRVIREKEFEGSILKPGDQFGGQNLTNPSYFSPAYYEVFKQYDGNTTFWNNAITKGYQIIDAADKNDKGLVPDWTDGNGNTTSAANQYTDQGKNFFYDAVRTPFRSAIDYLWHGRAAGKTYCEKLIAWSNSAHGGGTESLQSKYDINGNPLGGGHSNTFVACFGVAAMVTNNQSYLNRAYADNQSTNPTTGQYFNATFKAIGNFVMSGNFYLPPLGNCSGPELGDNKSFCTGSPVVLNAGVSANSYEWRRNGLKINGATSQTYSATQIGDYEVITNQDGCVRRDIVNVGAAALNADFVGISGPGSIIIENTSTGGVSSYSWEVDGEVVSTEESPVLDIPVAGFYDVKLTITNTGFGCSETDEVTKTIGVGDGEGVAMDDFNGLYDKGVNLYTYGPATAFDEFPVTYCSKKDADLGGIPQCQNHRCSYVDLVCNGVTAGNNWATMEFEFFGDGPFDLSNAAYVKIKVSATAPVSLAVRLGTPDPKGSVDASGNVKTFLSTAKIAAVTTEEQEFVFDFTNVLTGDVDGTSGTVSAWDAVTKLALRPYTAVPGYTGTISVDYVIVGSKALAPPTFNIRKDEFGYTDYDNYMPDYYPNDPRFEDCTPSSGEETGCYGSVPDWEREVIACGGTATIEAKACGASEIRWYQGTTLVETGDVATLAPGDYTVQLIGPGGTTTDVVKVIGSNPVADFSVDIENFDAYFINQSTGFDSFEWNYGDLANDLPGSTIWDIGYHSYATAGEKTYTVSLTVNDDVCNTSDTKTMQLVVECNVLPTAINVVDPVLEACAGETLTFEIDPIENADYMEVFYDGVSLGTELTSAQFTVGEYDRNFLIKASNVCNEATPDSLLIVVNGIPTPTSAFTLDPNSNGDVASAEITSPVGGSVYTWDMGDGSEEEGASVTHTYAESFFDSEVQICVSGTNECGTSTETCKPFTPTEPVGFVTFNKDNVSLFPTATTNSLTVELTGDANVTISDVLGNTISESTISNTSKINVSDLNAGMYILSIKQGNEVVNKRFIKE